MLFIAITTSDSRIFLIARLRSCIVQQQRTITSHDDQNDFHRYYRPIE